MIGVGTRRHVADVRGLAAFRVPVGPAGLLIGRAEGGVPVVLRFFQPEPTRVVAVGGWWLGRLLVFRALALGARVVVRTSAPDQWQGLSEWATSRPDRLAVVVGNAPIALPPASQAHPVLHLLDNAPSGTVTPELPWHTRLSLIHQITQPVPSDLQESDVRLVQRLTGPEAAIFQSQVRVSGQTTALLQALRADMLGVIGAGPDACIWVTPTAGEMQSLGAPRRQ